MTKYLLGKPVAVFMSTLAILLLGIYASFNVPTSLLPDIPAPELTIKFDNEDLSARELEKTVLRPLRDQLVRLSRLEDIECKSKDGSGLIRLLFEYGTNIDYAFIQTNEKIDESLNYLPHNISRPKVSKSSESDIPLFYLTISLKKYNHVNDFFQLSAFAETGLKKRIEQLEGVSIADISGQLDGEVVISLDKIKMEASGVTNEDIISAVKENNSDLGNLILKDGVYQYEFEFSNKLISKNEIEDIFIKIQNRVFQLKEFVDISLKPEAEKGQIFVNNNKAIAFAIFKKEGARIHDLKSEFEKLIQALKIEYPLLDISYNQDQTKLLKISISNLRASLIIGSILAILIMFFFLKDFKSPIIIAVSIPLSLIITLLFIYIFGMSINIISLSGLILGVGMMIDNSIIVIDNISQKLDSGLNLSESCIKGTREIVTPLISSVLTTCSVFLPLLFLSGISGAFFYDQAIVVTIALSSSLIVSLILIPVAYFQLNKRKYFIDKYFPSNLLIVKIDSYYKRSFDFFFAKKKIVYIISISSIIIAFIIFSKIEYTKLPKVNKNEMVLNVDWNENINLEESQHRLSIIFKDISNIETIFSKIGEQNFSLKFENSKSQTESTIYIKAKNHEDIDEIEHDLTKKLTNLYPKSSFYYTDSKTAFQYIFGSDKNMLIAEVRPKLDSEFNNLESLDSLSKLLGPYSDSKIPTEEGNYINILHENLLLYDVSYENLIDELKIAFGKKHIDNLKLSEKIIPIRLDYKFEKSITENYIRNKNGDYIQMTNLLKLEKNLRFKSITANRRGEYLGFNIKNTSQSIDSEIMNIKNDFDNNNFDVSFGGSWFDIKNINRQMLFVFIISILLLYFIMAAQFESFWQPLIILLEIPIDIGGALLLLWLFGGSVNLMSIIGIVVMSGVIINDSILKIHTFNMLRSDGFSLMEAIKKGGQLRLKPILMTSITTILALLPFLFMEGLSAELQKPLALTVIGGMIIGTFISLYLIPIMYFMICKKVN